MLSVQTVDDCLLLKVNADRFDATNASKVSGKLSDLRTTDASRIEIDLADVKMIDSSAIGILLSFYKQLPDPTPIVLKNPQPAVATVLEFLRLHRVFQLECKQECPS